MLTGIQVLKKSSFTSIIGPRDANRSRRKQVTKSHDGRKDLLAEAVRYANFAIDSHEILIRDGHTDMEEWKLSIGFETKARPMGWARRPAWGKCYGAKYLPDYVKEIKEMFAAGANNSSAKKGPGQMYEDLKRKHVGKYSLPRESEIRTAIGTLYSKQKAGAAAAASSAEGTEDVGDLGKRGRKSMLPHVVLDFIDAQVSAGEETSAILKNVRQKFGQQIRAIGSGESFVTDNQIKNRCNNLKSSKKSKVDV
jgi:hypothetical protein